MEASNAKHYPGAIKDLLRIFSEGLSIKRTFFSDSCLHLDVVPVFPLSFNFVLFAKQLTTRGHLCSKWQVLFSEAHIPPSILTNQWIPRAESSDSLVVSRMQFSFFQGKKDRTLLALEIETLNGTRAGDELAWSREAINRIFLIYDLSLLGAGARFEIDTCTCSERKGP